MSVVTEKEFLQFSFSKGEKQSTLNTNNLVLFINPCTMKTLKFNQGSLVLVQTEGGQLLFRCWPCSSLETSALMLSSMTIFQNYLKGPAYCDIYNLFLDSSDFVILNCNNPKSFMKTDLFKHFIKIQLNPVYIREGLQFNLVFLGHPCSFTVKKIYSNATDKMTYHDNLLDICSDISSLDINGGDSILEDSISESPIPFCSTPNTKHSMCHTKLSNQKLKQTKQFYIVNSSTKILIEDETKYISNSSQILLHDIGGLKKQVSEILPLIGSLLNQDSYQKVQNSGVILVGASGTGKTAIVQAVSNEYHIPLLNLNDFIFDSNEDDYKYQFKKLYDEVIDKSPCILFLDNIDNFCKNGDTTASHSGVLLLSTLICDLLNSPYNVLIIGAARDVIDVNTSLRKPGALQEEIYFEMPSANDRKEILNKILDKKHHNLNSNQIAEISEMTHGFSGGDLKALCDKVDISSPEAHITFEGFKETLKNVKPASMVEFSFERPKVKWSDIGGMHSIKNTVAEMVDWPLKHAEQFKKFGIVPSRGILLYGPPGCSKTMIAKALVAESHLNFISIKGPQFFNKYVGESEKAVSEVFKKARSAAPCVLFFDEIDSLTSIRGSTSGNSNVSERILTQLLIEIDGIDILQGVSIIAATNRPDMIDPSFLRPGRFDQMIYVPLPDTATRKEIFEAKLRNMPHAPDIDISYLVDATKGYTGAEIIDVCREAAMSAIKEYITSPSSVITMGHFLTALKSVIPRTSTEMIDFYENYSKRNVR